MIISKKQGVDCFSVNEYLDILNKELVKHSSRVIGEVIEVQLYPDRNYLFFKIKDKENPAVLTCMMWKHDYIVSGLDLEVGLEVIVSGTPGIYKPYGRFSFDVKTVELVGEGALKKQYEKLKAQLEKEGLFATSKKRPLPFLPQRIGLITSKDGAAIGDFQVNLGNFGFKVTMIDSRVEGQLATQELLDSTRTFRSKDIEVLVLVRGGGSLESFLPFNNEILVREIASFPVPVLVGVGHEKDISLIGLAADKIVSTPTATAQVLNESWREAIMNVELSQRKILSSFERALSLEQESVSQSFQVMKDSFQSIFDGFDQVDQALRRSFVSVGTRIAEIRRHLIGYPQTLLHRMKALINNTKQVAGSLKNSLERYSPEHQFKLGYSIAHSQGVIVRNVSQITPGQKVDVRVQDGSFISEVKIINKNK
ncbi:MAG: exodeoxyribonuclease VII large subunit [Candidatus Buchananbacteria bacterium CG10_big_fil_rev_8_21_14_0_10_33_19]|uniref:Exodeoxyribonuclease 7 large subunit n=1 Tax=Candidatus Buchananbacteria bacterium CG10_big_fil_rev_8_21_14_0_10_33_19 TaxID=1974525 RepID=A0A2H0W6A0_9BACT|nr:MAG: exodeoxyribonuclease VII large subunit [Candidatus Buchananbacteria bacterium CG10_big_fil_rev_8_21_14_0_10_33_19]